MTAQGLMNPERYASYFKFAVVRNPWERLLSEYRYIRNTPDHIRHFRVAPLSFEEFCVFQARRKDAHQHLCVRDRHSDCGLDFIGRFETLIEDVNAVCNRLNIKVRALPHLNQSRADDYVDVYDDGLQRFVAEAWRRDIEMFGYRFENDGANSDSALSTTFAARPCTIDGVR